MGRAVRIERVWRGLGARAGARITRSRTPLEACSCWLRVGAWDGKRRRQKKIEKGARGVTRPVGDWRACQSAEAAEWRVRLDGVGAGGGGVAG